MNSPCDGATDPTLSDLLVKGLDVAFVSINPSLYSAERGHYFARRSNKFWPCISRSTLTAPIREALGLERLGPEHDHEMPRFGIGFTDLVKRATPRAADVTNAEFVRSVCVLLEKVERFRPRIACFHGVTAYRHVHSAVAGTGDIRLGLQDARLGATRLFVVPNPSGANAHYSRAEQTAWYDALAAALKDDA